MVRTRTLSILTVLMVSLGLMVASSTAATAAPAAAQGDLGISLAAPATVSAGGTVAWTVTITNHGPSAAGDWSMKDPIPAGIGNVTWAMPGCAVTANGSFACPSWDCTMVASTLSCRGWSLPAGEAWTLQFYGTAGTSGRIRNTASVATTGVDTVRRNNTARVVTTIV